MLAHNISLHKVHDQTQENHAFVMPNINIIIFIHDDFHLLIQWTAALNWIIYTMQHDCDHFVY